MQNQNDANKNAVSQERGESFLRSSTLFYVLMAGVGLLLSLYHHKNFGSIYKLPAFADGWQLANVILLPLMGGAILLIANYLFEEQFPSYRSFRYLLMQLVGSSSMTAAFYLALVSALGEEILFRGAIQPALGMTATAFLFGLLHVGPRGLLTVWTLWAVLSGLMLGWLFEGTGTIWAPILCHFVVNASSMLRMRIQYRRFLEEHAKLQAKQAASKLLSGH